MFFSRLFNNDQQNGSATYYVCYSVHHHWHNSKQYRVVIDKRAKKTLHVNKTLDMMQALTLTLKINHWRLV